MRQPTIGRLIALLTGVTVLVLLTIDTTMACRFFMRRHYYSLCPPAVSYHATGPAHCESIVSGPISYGYSRYNDCSVPQPCPSGGYSGGHYNGMPVEGRVIEPTPTPPRPPIQPDSAGSGTSEVPSPPTRPAPTRADFQDNREVEPAIVEEPTDAAPVLPEEDLPADDLPDDEQPTDDLPEDDLFDEPPFETQTPDESDDDLFGPPADTNPPLEDPGTDDLDVFDQPAEDAPAEDAPAEDAPADGDAVDDLFGAPADDAPTQPAPLPDESPLPGFDEPLPADAPGDAVPAETDGETDSLDDLFGASPEMADDEEPRTASAVNKPAAGDLFDGLDAPADNAVPPAIDLFEEPAEAPAQPEQNNSVDDLDDLFGAQSAPAAPDTSRTTRPVAEQVRELPVRLWTDNTGYFQTVGRLVKVSNTHVRLLKDNGRYTTVPKYRLSEADMDYLSEVTQQLGVQTFDQVARR
jgi:hypothetical protein